MALTIAYINHVSSIGGAERSLLELMEGIHGAGYRTVLLAPAGPLLDSARAHGTGIVPVEFVVLGKADLFVRPLSLRRKWTALRAALAIALRESGASLIHANSLKSAIIAGPVARSLNVPLLWHVRDRVPVREPMRSVLIGIAQRNARLVLANSNYTLKTSGVRPSKGRVLLNGIPLQRYRAVSGSAETRARRIGIVGRISPEKGQDVFVRIAARLAPRYPDLRFRVIGDVFVGAARYGREIERMVRVRGLDRAFEWMPFRDEPSAIYAGIDVLVVPSRSEGFSRVVLESMACGVPVVAARVGGIPEIAGDGSGIRYFPPGSDSQAAVEIRQLLDDPKKHERLSIQSMETAKRFPLDAMINKLEAIYREALNG